MANHRFTENKMKSPETNIYGPCTIMTVTLKTRDPETESDIMNPSEETTNNGAGKWLMQHAD